MTAENYFEIEGRATTPEDEIFLALCCNHKNLAVKLVERNNDGLSLKWQGNRVVGAAAICLFLEAAIPEPSLFPNGNIGMPVALLHWLQSMNNTTAQNEESLTANALLISRQLEDGRPFLQGPSFGLADICAASWCLLHRNLFSSDLILKGWASRMEKALTPSGDTQISRLPIPEKMLSDKQYQGLINYTQRDDITIFTSPLDGVIVPEEYNSKSRII